MRIAVYGLWHLGCVTAACLAAAGHRVVGLDMNADTVASLREGRLPLHEPGLDELTAGALASGQLRFTAEPGEALRDSDVLWVTFDTPVDDHDQADVASVRDALERVASAIRPGTLVLISSQVPVGFTGALQRDWAGRGLGFAYSPENLRLGRAIESFRQPERVVIGVDAGADEARARLHALFAPFCERLEWMSVASAEMTKHAVNAFLATSVAFVNEVARICEVVGADAKEVERGLKSEGRIGPRAYLSPGSAFAGGTLARDVRFLLELGRAGAVETPLFAGVWASNEVQHRWLHDTVGRAIAPIDEPVVAVLGLTYKPGTSTLRRSIAVELCTWLVSGGSVVRAHDPAIAEFPEELDDAVTLCATPHEALGGADVAVICTPWPEFRSLVATDFLAAMRRPIVIDPNRFLAELVTGGEGLRYVTTGRVAHGAAR